MANPQTEEEISKRVAVLNQFLDVKNKGVLPFISFPGECK
jgi:hypothetical protein